MAFTDSMISDLILRIKRVMSEKRFSHTLSVMDCAVMLCKYIAPEHHYTVASAALLHDIAKEIPIDEQISILCENGVLLSDSDLNNQGVIHSYTAPFIVKRDFSEFATDEVLSAVKNHTLGSPDMSLIDEIIFLSDFIEEKRSYPSCKALRETVISSLSKTDISANIKLLHEACIQEIDYTLAKLICEKKYINHKIILTRNALLGKI